MMPRVIQHAQGENFVQSCRLRGLRGSLGVLQQQQRAGKDLGCSATILGHFRSGARRVEACRERECEEEEEQGGRSQHSHSHPDAAANAPGSISVSLSINQGVL